MTPSVNPGSPRMFESDFLERFSRAHPLTPVVLYGPLVADALYVARQRETLGAIAFGLLGGYAWFGH